MPAYLVQDATRQYMHQGFSISSLDDPESCVRFIMDQHKIMRDQRILFDQGLYLDNPISIISVKKTLYRRRYKQAPPTAVVKQWVSEAINALITNLSPLPHASALADVVVGANTIQIGVFNITMNTEKTVPWSDIIAIRITSLPPPEGLGHVGVIGLNGEGQIRDRIVGTANAAAESPEVLMPANCSLALGRANLTAEKGAIAVNPYPFPGADGPNVIDASTGNPHWPTKSELGHLDEPGSPREQPDGRLVAIGLGANQADRAQERWTEVDEAEDWSFLSSDSEGEGNGDDASEALGRLTLNGKSLSSHYREPQPPVAIYRNVPAHIAKAAVYLACEDVKFPEGSQGYTLTDAQPIYGFTDTLHYRGFGLDEVPDTFHNTPLDPNDELYQWLGTFSGWEIGQAVPNGFALSMCKVAEWPLDPSKKEKLDFAITVPFVKGPPLQFSTNKGAKYTFSKVEKSDKADKSVTETSLRNMHVSRRSLIFGLEDSDVLLKTNLADVAKFIRLDLKRYGIFNFKSFDSQMELTLDTKKDFHNALWFRPALEYETILRLQFHMDMTRFNDWLHTFNPNLSVDDVLLIARKRSTWKWKKEQDGASFSSSFDCLCRMTISTSLQLTGVFELSQSAVGLTLTLDKPSNTARVQALQGRDGALSKIIKWLKDTFNITKAEELDGLLKQAADSKSGALDNDSILPRRVQLMLELDGEGKIKGVSTATIDIEVCLTVGRSEAMVLAKMPVLFLFSFGWNKTSGFYFKGKLWTSEYPLVRSECS
jgi:hypothetical protein